MQIDKPKGKCLNPSCGCEVEDGLGYCSEFCLAAVEGTAFGGVGLVGHTPCRCGHIGCGGGYSPSVARRSEHESGRDVME